ncbi:MAG: hypothetical protein CMF31_06745 [Kordiimonas sp.]|nr:hypothetical protein [Kordiimonas sp.]
MFYKDFISWYIYCLLYLRKDKLGDLWAGYITPGKPYPHEHINILGDYPVSLYLKTSSRKRSTSCLAALVALPLMLTAAQAQPIFNITDLGTLGGNFSHTYDINDHGQVTGISRNASDELRAFIWDQTNGMQDLGTLGGNYSSGRGINNQGQVTGISRNASNESRAFIWDQTNGMQSLGTLPGSNFSRGGDINDHGQVVGDYTNASDELRAFIWDQTNGMQDLGTLGGNYSSGRGINNQGQITGRSKNASNKYSAFLWDQTNGMQDLSTPLGVNNSSGIDINNQGQVTGISINASDEFRAFIWDQTNGIEDLGNIPNYMSQSSAINDRGEVTGTASIVGFSERAFLWDQTNGMMDLNNLIDINDPLFGQVRLTGAYGINNNGDIIAIEHDFWNNGGRQTRAFLLTRQQVTNNNPTGVSEPGLLGLMGLGLVGMRLATRRQKAGT